MLFGLFAAALMKTPGLLEVEKTMASFCTVFLHFVFMFYRLCFPFSPPWLEVHDITSGQNLLKAFNKRTVLEKKVFFLYFFNHAIRCHKYDWISQQTGLPASLQLEG